MITTSSRRAGGVRSVTVLALGLAGGLAGCATAPAAPGEAGGPSPEAARGVPGFDTRDYPGDGVMRSWLRASPYRWVGYYLPAPCYTGTSWQGKRAALRAMGWGIAVLFVGEQSWPARPGARSEAPDTGAHVLPPPPDAAEARCTRANLTAGRGQDDGAAAARAAAAEGFPAGAAIFLDVERTEEVSDSLAEYVRGWTRGLLEDGRYEPALYAHARNADALLRAMVEAAAASPGAPGADAPDAGGRGTDGAARAFGGRETPRLWVASTGGFNLRRGPAESGFPAAIWQGVLDAHETWGGTTLRIDINVADSSDPSG